MPDHAETEKPDHYSEDPWLCYLVPCVSCVHREKSPESPDCPCKECRHYAA
jgi:hypothetical protein